MVKDCIDELDDAEFEFVSEFFLSDEGGEALAEARRATDDGAARQTVLARRLVEWNAKEEYETGSEARALGAKLRGMGWAEVEGLVREAGASEVLA